MFLSIITPETVIFDGTATKVELPGTQGRFTVLDHHAPIISSLEKGMVRYVVEGQEFTHDIESGFVEVSDNHVNVVCEC